MPIHSEYTESFSEFTQGTKVDILHRKNSDQAPRSYSESEYTESFSEFTQKTKVDILQRKNSDQATRSPKFKRSVILLFHTYFKVTQNRIKHCATIIHLKTQSNLYKVNSSRHYKCKGLFTEEFQQYFRIAESSDSQGEDRIS